MLGVGDGETGAGEDVLMRNYLWCVQAPRVAKLQACRAAVPGQAIGQMRPPYLNQPPNR
jgi:hypothetical protein